MSQMIGNFSRLFQSIFFSFQSFLPSQGQESVYALAETWRPTSGRLPQPHSHSLSLSLSLTLSLAGTHSYFQTHTLRTQFVFSRCYFFLLGAILNCKNTKASLKKKVTVKIFLITQSRHFSIDSKMTNVHLSSIILFILIKILKMEK